ncbi:unnamed protein product [[Candida] boidinii]|uniref:Unnamed protein product n=1 Tax=Candida boidinii TaxID=5477 RepID=A0ACB5TU88_CANBO|nr:unnamed protein product [[Candida] boidinii]
MPAYVCFDVQQVPVAQLDRQAGRQAGRQGGQHITGQMICKMSLGLSPSRGLTPGQIWEDLAATSGTCLTTDSHPSTPTNQPDSQPALQPNGHATRQPALQPRESSLEI